MKNVLNVLLSALVAVFLIGIIGFSVNGCTEGGIKSYFLPEEEAYETADQAVEAIVNPELGSVADVVNFHSTLNSNMQIDSLFMALPETTIIDVSSVLLKSKPTITKKDIVNEYQAHRSIYDNLPKPDVPKQEASTTTEPLAKVELVNESSTTVTEAPPTRVEEKSTGSYKDTIIDGKQAIIKE